MLSQGCPSSFFGNTTRVFAAGGLMMLLHAFSGIFSLLLVVALGYWLAERGWFSESCVKMLPRLVTNVALPPFLGCTIISSFQRDQLAHMFYGAILPLFVMIALFLLAWRAGKALGIEKRHFGLFCASVSNPNTIFIGIPVNQALFGPQALQYVLLYYFASTLFFWTVGNWFISRDEGARNPDSANGRAFEWQKIISPPLMGFIAGLAVVLFEWKVPGFIFRAASITGELTTPLALLFIGITLQKIGFRSMRPRKDLVLALCGRMIVSPLLMWLALRLVSLPPLMGNVFVIQSALPVLLQVAILGAYYGTDPEFGSIMVSASTILAVFTVPVIMWLL